MNSLPALPFEDREGDHIDRYILPLPSGITLLHPERVLLDFGKGEGLLDFGAVCYLRRDFGRRAMRKGTRVDTTSFDQGRQEIIRLVIETVDRHVRFKVQRLTTLHRKYRHFLTFIDWCDRAGKYDVLNHANATRHALKAYVGDLHRRVGQHQLSPNSAAILQADVIYVLDELFQIDNLTTGINLIRKDTRLIEPTQVPDELSVAKVLIWCECLLIGFTDLLTNERPYPFALTVPAYLDMPEDRLWIFPGTIWAIKPGNTIALTNKHFDYANGRLRTPEEVLTLSNSTLATLRLQNREVNENLAAANANALHHTRIDRGILAVKSYLLLLLSTSGQPLSVVTTLAWNEELEAQALQKNATRQQFRNIKYRAGGVEITFEVGANHVRLLQYYLRLRKFILAGRRCDYLFLNFGQNRSSEPDVMNGSRAIHVFYKTLKSLDPDLPRIPPREFRAAKADFLIRITDSATAAISMQHSQETARKSYYNGSQITHAVEFSALFKRMENKVKILKTDAPTLPSEERAAGNCGAPQHPKAVIDNPPVTPDCKLPEGCFFCQHYHVHADEKDVHKLVSARMCIRHKASQANSHEEFKQIYEPILTTIEVLVDQIRSHNPSMVAETEHRVEQQGELTAYWSAKMRVWTAMEGLL